MTNEKITSSTKSLPKSQSEITASIPAHIFDATRSKAIERLGANIEFPGFRKGHVPEQILVSKIGEAAILEEMAEITIGKAYPILVAEHKLDIIGRPQVRITKVAQGNPLEFVITTDVFPTLQLPDYANIAKKVSAKKESITVTDEDIEKTITEIRKIKAKQLSEETGKPFSEESELPPLTDEMVKQIGSFSDVSDFRTKLRENITNEKQRTQNEQLRINIIEAILKETSTDLPGVIVEQELARMEDEFANEIKRMGMQFDDYMKQLGKTRDDMRKDWGKEAEKRATVQLIVSEIARKESLFPDDTTVEREVQKLHIMYPNAPIERIKSYVDMMLSNELVFQFLEGKEVARNPQPGSHVHEDGTVHHHNHD